MKEIIEFPFGFRNKTGFLLERFLNKDNPAETLYMAPHLSKIRDFKMKHHLLYPQRSLPPYSHSLKTLALKLLDEFSDCRIISEVEKYAAILAILKKQGAGDEIFRHNLSGTALAILQFIKDVKTSSESGLDYESIRQGVKNYRWKFDYNLEVVLKAVDVMERYEGFLKRESLIDAEDIYKEACAHIDKVMWKNLVVEGFYEIPPYQKSFFSALLQKIDSVAFAFCYEESVPVDVKELILEKTLGFLHSVCGWRKTTLECGAFKNKVECYNFSSQPEEIKGMVKLIWEYFKKNPGTSFDDIMAVFPSMLSYRPVVQRIFGRYKLPCEIVPGYSLSSDSSISTLLEVFNFHENFDWETLMDILFSPHLKKMDMEKAERFSAFSRREFEHTGFFMENFSSLQDGNARLIKKMLGKTQGGEKSCEEWINAIYAIISTAGWRPGLPEVKYSFERVLESLKTKARLSKEEFLSMLIKSFELVDIQEGKGHGVKVSGVLESVGIEKKLCFIGGATEENIPQSPSLEEVFIPDMLKKELGFTNYTLRIARERFDVYRLKKENEHVVFTYPSKISGENRMKSIFLFQQQESALKEDFTAAAAKKIFHFEFSQEKFKKKFIAGGKLRLSVTQFEKLMKCPYRFYIENVESMDVYKKPEIDEAPDLWGTVIHFVMQKIFSGYKGRTLSSERREEFETMFRNETAGEIKSRYKEGRISAFYRDVMMMRLNEVASKFNSVMANHFEVRLEGVEEEIFVELPDIILNGKIDRIEKLPSGEVAVIDIKTGTSKPPSYTENDFFNNSNLQLPLYIWMYMENHNIRKENISGGIWSFRFQEEKSEDVEKIYTPKKLSYLNEIENYLARTAQGVINKKDFTPGRPADCFFCRYKGMCPYEKT